MNTKKEYSPIRTTLIVSLFLIITTTSFFLISNSKYGGLNIGKEAVVEDLEPEDIEDDQNNSISSSTNYSRSATTNSLSEREKGYDCYKMTQETEDTDNDGYFELAKNPSYYKGDIVPEVKKIEKALNFKKPDKKFLENTKIAVKNFQRNHGLTPDGVVGPKTAKKLGVSKISKKYTLVNTADNAHKHQGKKNTLNVIQTFTQSWKFGKYGSKKLYIRDLNAPNHTTHNEGLSVDIYSPSNLFKVNTKIKGTDSDGDHILEQSTNANYNKDHAILLGKKIAKTRAIEYIIYGDSEVNSEVNKFVVDNSLGRSDMMQLPSAGVENHKDHFHVQVKANTSCRNW